MSNWGKGEAEGDRAGFSHGTAMVGVIKGNVRIYILNRIESQMLDMLSSPNSWHRQSLATLTAQRLTPEGGTMPAWSLGIDLNNKGNGPLGEQVCEVQGGAADH